MAILKIVTEEDEILRKVSKPVDNINDRVIRLLDDMRDTLIASGGVGLAAVQVGYLKRIYLVDVTPDDENDSRRRRPRKHEIIEFINPEVVKCEGEQEGSEGCLSLPGKFGIVKRPMKATVKALDRNGNEFIYTGEELYARCLLHEYDHLDGVLYCDRATEMYEQED